MDAFYASVEQRDQPALRGKPVIVGSPPDRRGVVAAASYEARRFGVRSAMPSATAGRLCPQGIFVPPRMERYREESRQIIAIIGEAGGIIEQVSIDEAYREVSDPLHASDSAAPEEALQSALPIARELKLQIREQRELTAGIGRAAHTVRDNIARDFQ